MVTNAKLGNDADKQRAFTSQKLRRLADESVSHSKEQILMNERLHDERPEFNRTMQA